MDQPGNGAAETASESPGQAVEGVATEAPAEGAAGGQVAEDDPLLAELAAARAAKERLDREVAEEVASSVGECEASLAHVLGALRGALQADGHRTLKLLEQLQSEVEGTSVALAGAMAGVDELVARVQQLNDEMGPVHEMTAQVRQISATLTILENIVRKLERERRKK